ncbi:MAG: hypothetical protein IJW13_02955 [Clostridia bacterium]|nr:hypothetical protein [Clostridia bacterium]
MKKLITLLMVLVLAISCFAGCVNVDKKPGNDDKNSTSTQPGGSEGGNEEQPGDEGYVDADPETNEQLNFGWKVEGDANVTYDTTPLNVGKAADPNAKYTYRTATLSLPTNWNSHTYQSNDATTVTSYTTDSLFTFDYNQEMDGYRIVPSMAQSWPEDVTSDYVGKWNIEDGDANRVYKVVLRNDLKFDNGDPITAATFVESYKLLLNPEAANYRADTYFKGNLIIANSRKYALQGQNVYSDCEDTYASWEEATADGDKIYFDLASGNSYFSNWCKENYASYVERYGYAGMLPLFGCEASVEQIEALQGKSWNEIKADEAMMATWEAIIGIWKTEPDEEMNFFCTLESFGAMDFSEVGFFADEEENAIIVVNEAELSGFYLLYSFATDFLLVHPETYKQLISNDQGIYTNSYGTAADKYVGFGPYKLDSYIADNKATFVKNPYWYGYALEENANYYHTTNIEISQVTDEQTRLNMFLQGKLDAYGLQAADMEDYQGSKHTYFTEGDSTWFVALNPSFAGLKAAQEAAKPTVEGNEVNKTILTIKEFRQALSFSIDRAAYALALDPLGGTAKALYGNMIISDPNKGIAYRTTEEAKDVILKFWGLDEEVGGDGIYETKDEAIASITGYDLAGAKTLFDQAYDKAVEQGLISADAAESGKFEIQIVIGQPGEGGVSYYNNGYELLKQVWTDAVKGTKLEGKLVFTQSQPLGSSNFATFLHNNSVDVLFGVGWTGSALDPYGLMGAYTDPEYQYDPGWDTKATQLDVTLTDKDGVTYTLRASVYDWGTNILGGIETKVEVIDKDGKATGDYVMINGGTTCDASIRLAILAAVEGAVLQQYNMIPINLDSSAALKGMKIKYGTEEYVFGVGRGGVKYMTYNYTDAQWAEFVAAQGGTLNYK